MRLSLLLCALVACSSHPLEDRPRGMLAPFPIDEQGRTVPHEKMVPYLVEQAVAIALGPSAPLPPPAPARGALPLVDPRNEPVLVLSEGGVIGLSARWPAQEDWTLRPPTRDELIVRRFAKLSRTSPLDAYLPVLAFLREEALRKRPGLQRGSDGLLLVAEGSALAEEVRAIAAVLRTMGPMRKLFVTVEGPDGRWAKATLRPSTSQVPALAPPPRHAASPAPRAREKNEKLARILATPLPAPACHELALSDRRALPAALALVLEGAAPEDVVAIHGLSLTLDEFLHPERLVGSEAARVLLDDTCD